MSVTVLTGTNDKTTKVATSGSSVVVDKPSALADGDALLSFIVQQGVNGPGWTHLHCTSQTFLSNADPSDTGMRTTEMWGVAVPTASSQPSTYTWDTPASAGRWNAFMVRVQGLNSSLSVTGSSRLASPTTSPFQTFSLTGLTGVTPGSLVMLQAHAGSTAAQGNPTWTTAATGGGSWGTRICDLNTVVSGSASNDGLLVEYFIVGSDGVVPGVSVNAGRAQSSINGQMVVLAAAAATNTIGVTVLNASSSEILSTVTIWDGTVAQPVKSVTVKPATPTVTLLDSATSSAPQFIAHRGGSLEWPEETVYAYTQSANLGMRWLEISLWLSSDGVWVCSHDKSTLRTTTTDLDITATPWSTLSALQVKALSPANTSQPTRPMARLEDVLALYGADHGFFIEDKANTHVAQLLDYLTSLYADAAQRFVLKAGGLSAGAATIAHTKGYKAWGYFFVADQASFASNYSNWDYVGLDINSDDSTLASNISLTTGAGKKPIGHVIASTTQRNRMLTAGCTGLMCSLITGNAQVTPV